MYYFNQISAFSFWPQNIDDKSKSIRSFKDEFENTGNVILKCQTLRFLLEKVFKKVSHKPNTIVLKINHLKKIGPLIGLKKKL